MTAIAAATPEAVFGDSSEEEAQRWNPHGVRLPDAVGCVVLR